MSIKEQKDLACIEINPPIKATHTVIWLHGLGADGNDFAPLVPALQLPPHLAIRFVFPHAPIMPVTVNNGYEMRAWYDIFGMNIDHRIDKTGMDQSIELVNQLIEKETKAGISSDRIILAGFSQGAVIALLTGLSYPKKLGGILALSGYFPFAEEVLKKTTSTNKHMPIFIAHGTADPIVPFILGKTAAEQLTQAGYPVSWHSYPIQHAVSEKEIQDLSLWLQGNFGSKLA